ncbi:rhodanese-like domain-containing protein [Devosia sp.]|uniref:rhodanese-like domain-containing protein n=1 Tax=Devosia sp. TaxID=1871048 RepID=UPI002AFDD281|nr:rhodanese-like domain-containing protein [Devosia sp.]
MKKAVSIAMTVTLLASLPALGQDGFNQMPSNNGFNTQNPNFQQQPSPNFQQQPSFQQPQPSFQQPQPSFQQPQPQPSFQQPQQQPNQTDMMMQQLQQMAQLELQDYGIQPTQQLHDGAMHGPTPNSIPGARVTTTAELFQLVMGNQQPYLLFDVLGGDQTLPGAIMAVNAAQPGSFQDQTQQGFGQFLQQVTGGRQDATLIFYCASTQCWMSYNAALRAANLGYRNVLWYRGGLEAWSYAGLPTMPAGGGMMPQNPGGAMAPNMGGGGMMMPGMNGGGAMMPNTGY